MASNEKYFAELDRWETKAELGENRGAAVDRIKAWIGHADPDRPLDLRGLSLTSLPPHLPPELKILSIRNNKLRGLPESLSATDLQHLDAFGNELDVLPKKWPPRLSYLNIARNKLTYLSKSLPDGLRHLYAYDNDLPCLPEPLPASLETLEVGGNNLIKLLKKWPPQLKHLVVSNNLLTCLTEEELPAGLLHFNAYNNQLISVPEKWPAGLLYLDVSCNKLTQLFLPGELQSLIASGNKLKRLSSPLSARMRELDLADNRLNELPELPDSLWRLSVNGNYLAHLPESLFSMLARGGRINVDNNPFSDEVRERYQAEVRARSGSATLKEAVSKWNGKTEGPKTDWSRFHDEEGTMEFVKFLDRLRLAVGIWKDDPEFNKKTVEWLDQLASDPELREKTFHLAIDATANCQDRVSLTFNAMKKARIANDVRKGKYDRNPEKLISLARGMFRLDALEKIAYEKVKSLRLGHEEVEVYLAYQIKLRDTLQLPLDTLEMLHFNVSELTKDDLIEAEKKVKKAENKHFLYYLSAEWDPWESVLERMDKPALDEARDKLADCIEKSFEQRLNARYAKLQRKIGKAATAEEKAFYQQAMAALPAKISKKMAYPIKEELTRAFMQKQNIPLALLDSPWKRGSEG